MKGLNNYLEHSFAEAWIPDHVGGVEYYELCEYCGHEDGTISNCLTKQKYEDIKNKQKQTREVVAKYWEAREKHNGGRRRMRSV